MIRLSILALIALGTLVGCTADDDEDIGVQASSLTGLEQQFYSDFVTTFPGANHGLLTTTPPTTAGTSPTGWTVGRNGAGLFCSMQRGVERASSTFSTVVEPSKQPRDLLGNALVYGPMSGTYSAGDFFVSTEVASVSRAGANGRMRVRVWKSPDATGGLSSLELTTQSVALSTVSGLTSAGAVSSGPVPVSQNLTLSNEYLLVQFAWETTGSGGNASADVLVRRSLDPVVTTTDFVP